MPVFRERPYVQFNFLVNIGNGTDGPDAGFQEVSGITMEVTVSEHRFGNSRDNNVMKITGLNKSSDITLKRGVVGSRTLYDWFDNIRLGQANQLRTVVIQLQNEDHSAVVMTWTLSNARIIKYTAGPLNAKGNDVAMEEIVMAYERLVVE